MMPLRGITISTPIIKTPPGVVSSHPIIWIVKKTAIKSGNPSKLTAHAASASLLRRPFQGVFPGVAYGSISGICQPFQRHDPII
jgi:hypothetical protein